MQIYYFNFYESFVDFVKEFILIYRQGGYKYNRKDDVFIYFSMDVISL